MSVYIFDDVLSIDDATKVEGLVKNGQYKPTAHSTHSIKNKRNNAPSNYYPFELPKGLKLGEWEEQQGPNRHWITEHGSNKKSLDSLGLSWVDELWNGLYSKLKLKEKFQVDEYSDAYINVHSHGQEPHLHSDENSGNMTLLYYPILNWDQWNWGGGTTIWDKDIETVDRIEELEVLEHVTNKGNRVVLFDAWHWHKAEAVARICHDMRYSIAYKTIANGGNNERLDFYNE